MAIGSSTSRQIGKLCRIYKNLNGAILAIDDVAIVADTQRIHKLGIFHQSAVPHHQRELFHMDTTSRVIATIQIFGDYSSITIDDGKYLTGTWKNDENTNDVIISFEYLPTVGDVI